MSGVSKNCQLVMGQDVDFVNNEVFDIATVLNIDGFASKDVYQYNY